MKEKDLEILAVMLGAASSVIDSIKAAKNVLKVLDDNAVSDLQVCISGRVATGGESMHCELALVPSFEKRRAASVVELDSFERQTVRTLCEARVARLEAHLAEMKVKL